MANRSADERHAGNNSTMTIPQLILTYLIALLAALAGVVIYSEMRQRRFRPTESSDRVFRCWKCGFVYTDDPDVDRSRCSQCGQVNEAIQF
jgi:hypothetical protein